MTRGRLKSKSNRLGICFCCNGKIENRFRNALYCKRCYKLIQLLKSNIYQTIQRFKKRYKEYDVEVKRKLSVTLKKK